MEAKRTKPCPYCGGSGKHMRYYEDHGKRFAYEGSCTDCVGSGKRCILCCKAPVDCECPSTAFDGDYSEMDRPAKP